MIQTKELLQYQEKDTDVDERTAELYSKQGNTDVIELEVIDEMTQCEVCKEQELSAEKTETLKETTKPQRSCRISHHET